MAKHVQKNTPQPRWKTRCTFAVATLLLAASSVMPAIAQDRGDNRGRYAPDSEIREAFEPIVDQARQSVVTIMADGDARGLATIIDAKGLALAKASDLVGHEELAAWKAGGGEYPVQILSVDRVNDLALLQIDTDEPMVPVVFTSKPSKLGEWVVCAGPEPRPRAVGIVATISRGIESPRLVLGVMLRPHPDGLVVDALTQGYGAAQAGIQRGDIITHIEEDQVIAIQQVAKRLGEFASGEKVNVLVTREGRSFKMEVELREIQPDPRSRAERMRRMGSDVSQRNSGFESVIQHDAEMDPEDCGGPLVNIDGEVIGLNIARAGRISSYALPSDLVIKQIKQLKADIDEMPNAKAEMDTNVHEAAAER